MKNKLFKWYLYGVALLLCVSSVMAMAQEGEEVQIELDRPAVDVIPEWEDTFTLADLASGSSFQLLGLRNSQLLEFTLRRDQVVKSAELNLIFTPSPALLPKLSHMRVYLNDEMMGVVSIDNAFPGQQVQQTVRLDPLVMTRFNRIRLEFVGHYTDICEDLTHSSLWLDISRQTNVKINQQLLSVTNDLSYFPEPFFDGGDMTPQELPFVFTQAPSNDQLKASAILSSYFGSQAKWRAMSFPAFYNQLPEQHAVVFATNANRPDFLQHYPKVEEPTVELMSLPGNAHYKLLLILGRDDADLVTAASALAIGNPLFRGQSVSVDKVQHLAPREPYDAPNWVPTDRPVFFSELMTYPEQFEVSGLMPRPINLNINLPPDLFVWRNAGIPMEVLYRYVSPKNTDESRLTLSLNNRYIDSYPLASSDEKGALTQLRLPLRGDEETRNENLLIPALKVGAQNQIRFDFSFASTLGGAQKDLCQTVLPVDVRAAIDGNSMIDFSGFPHYLAMPNLRAFAGSAFPFSRMADLSETVVVMPEQPTLAQTTTFLEAIADMGAQIGYPALKVRVMSDWDAASQLDADLLLIGSMPEAMKARPDANLLLQDTQATLYQPRLSLLDIEQKNDDHNSSDDEEQEALSAVTVRSLAPMAAIVGLQSESYPQRSIVGLLATTDEDFGLLRNALASSGKRAVMEGSVVLVRESGVASDTVGPTYYVGHLAWWRVLWYNLSDKPLVIAVAAFALVLLVSLLLWGLLRQIARKRLERDA